MPDADKIRAELSRWAVEKVKAKGRAVRAQKELLRWLREAHASKSVSMNECAQLIGLKHRETVYELLKEGKDGNPS